jgi:hypothetical protein
LMDVNRRWQEGGQRRFIFFLMHLVEKPFRVYYREHDGFGR